MEEFKIWLSERSNYQKETINNIVSRVRRANKILPIQDDDIYFYYLDKCSEFSKLSSSVRSQIKKAVRLYLQYKGGKKSGSI